MNCELIYESKPSQVHVYSATHFTSGGSKEWGYGGCNTPLPLVEHFKQIWSILCHFGVSDIPFLEDL